MFINFKTQVSWGLDSKQLSSWVPPSEDTTVAQREPNKHHLLSGINSIRGLCAPTVDCAPESLQCWQRSELYLFLIQLLSNPISVRKPRYIRREQHPDKNRDPSAFSTVEAHISNV